MKPGMMEGGNHHPTQRCERNGEKDRELFPEPRFCRGLPPRDPDRSLLRQEPWKRGLGQEHVRVSYQRDDSHREHQPDLNQIHDVSKEKLADEERCF